VPLAADVKSITGADVTGDVPVKLVLGAVDDKAVFLLVVSAIVEQFIVGALSPGFEAHAAFCYLIPPKDVLVTANVKAGHLAVLDPYVLHGVAPLSAYVHPVETVAYDTVAAVHLCFSAKKLEADRYNAILVEVLALDVITGHMQFSRADYEQPSGSNVTQEVCLESGGLVGADSAAALDLGIRRGIES
jgi:hypothetical protein